MLFYQCRFRRGPERTVAWIEARGAKPGARVQLISLDDGAAWDVEAVLSHPLSSVALQEMQALNRNTFVDDKRNRKRKPVD